MVVSALSGVTNELTAIADGAADSAERIGKLEQRHREFVAELELDADQVLGDRLSALRALATDPRAGERTLPGRPKCWAQGELLSSTLGAAYLRAQGLDFGWTDARQWLQANVAAQPERMGAAAVGVVRHRAQR